MKVAIYCRTSTREQHPENQRIKLVEYAERNGWEHDVFEEKESTRNTRPIKEQVLDLLRKKKYDAVLVYKLDRWGRSLRELVMEFDEFLEKGIGFISYGDNIDLTTTTGRLHAQIMAAFAEYERAIISERTRAGLERAKSEGKKLGRPRKTPGGSKSTQWRERKKTEAGRDGVHQ